MVTMVILVIPAAGGKARPGGAPYFPLLTIRITTGAASASAASASRLAEIG